MFRDDNVRLEIEISTGLWYNKNTKSPDLCVWYIPVNQVGKIRDRGYLGRTSSSL